MTVVDRPKVAAPSPAAKPTEKSAPERTRRYRAVRTVEIPQMEDADCGAACLSIILQRHGRRVRLSEVRRRCGIGRDGMTVVGFGRAAATYGIEIKGRWIEASDPAMIATVPVPAVALLDHSHYAILEGIRRGKVWLNDPAVGRLRLSTEAFAERSNGLLLTAYRTNDFAKGGPRLQFVRAVLARLRRYLSVIVVAGILGVVAALPAMVTAMAMRALLNRVVVLGDVAWRPALLGVLAGGAVVAALAGWAQQRVVAGSIAVMGTRFSAGYLTSLLRLPGEFFHRRQLTGLVNRVQMNDGLAIALSERFVMPITALVTISGYVALLGWLSPRLLVVIAVAAVLQFSLLRAVSRVAGPHTQRLLFEQLRRDSTAFGGLKMIETIKADGAERWLFRSWLRSALSTMRTSNELGSATLGVLAVSAAVAPAALAGLAVVGALDVAAGHLDIGTLLTAQLVAGALLGRLQALVGMASDVAITKVHLSVLDDALSEEPHPARLHVLDRAAPPQPAPHRRLAGRVEFEAVSFGYDPHNPPLITGLSFAAEPGQWVAVVGATGSGKSTFARLAVGGVEPWSGRILLDGQPRATYRREVLAASIGYVEQTLRLFEGSLRDNLTLWDASVPDQELHAALGDACIDGLVRQRGGLDSGQVDEHARNLSGGEQQRLELGRALVGDPPILVLDEATSALDSATEHTVLEALRRRGATCLFIAHRISTVRDADLILVLDKGTVVQRGRHDELVATPGPYRRLAIGSPDAGGGRS